MHKSRESIDQQQAALMGYDRPAGNRFPFYGMNRKTTNIFNNTWKYLKGIFFKTLKIS
jgi:hypothetical protein